MTTTLLEQLQIAVAERYKLDRRLGEGGMAIVFLATDLKHDRQVALKVLRPELSAALGADRFLREIHVTAQLQHPHILPLYDSGAAGELLYYVMPLVRGESLRDRLKRERQLPVDDVISITRAVAGALDYAHRQGVLHRDIKPENILLHDGQPLVADFGIALAVSSAAEERLTHSGFAIGTPNYMSPEQVTGEQALDARSDIYALATVAYEMLAGEPPFTGASAQAVIAAMMSKDPPPLTDRRRTVPVAVAAAIERALERLPADRFATAAEFAAALTAEPRLLVRQRSRAAGRRGSLAVGAAAGMIAGVLIGYLIPRETQVATRRWSIVLPDNAPVALRGPSLTSGWQTAIAISPSGDRLAYVTPQGSSTVLAIRGFENDSVVTVTGTEGAYHPFYSPDGAWIAFFSGNLLRKVPAAGGTPITLAEVNRITGATWATPDSILVMQNDGFNLHWISASGTTADSAERLTTQFGNPQMLPGGNWAVGQLSSGQLALLSLKDGSERAITRRGVLPLDSVRQSDLLFGTSPRWIEPGYLVYGAGDGVLMALPFDARRREVLGEPASLLAGVRMEDGFGYAEFAISTEGTLVYVPGGNQLYVDMAFISPQGAIDTLPVPRGPYTQPRLSPDGTRLAVQVRNPVGGWEVLLIDLRTGVRQQVEVEGNYRAFPASWLPSGRDLMIGLWDPVQFLNYGARIQSLETGAYSDMRLDGASYMTVSPDGKQFVFSDWRTGDLYLRALGADSPRRRIPARGFAASFSPDGRWVAWGGVNGEVAVASVPASGAIHAVAERGSMPVWTPKGDAIIYRSGARYYQVPISTTGGFRVGQPKVLIEGSFLSTFAWNHSMGPDGRLLVLMNRPEQHVGALRVITAFPSVVEGLARSK